MTKEEKHEYLINNGWKSIMFHDFYLKDGCTYADHIFGDWFTQEKAFKRQKEEDYKQEFDKLVND